MGPWAVGRWKLGSIKGLHGCSRGKADIEVWVISYLRRRCNDSLNCPWQSTSSPSWYSEGQKGLGIAGLGQTFLKSLCSLHRRNVMCLLWRVGSKDKVPSLSLGRVGFFCLQSVI